MAAAPSSSSTTQKRLDRTYTKLLPPHVTSAAEAYDEWLQYAWIGGAGLPLAKPPIILERGACRGVRDESKRFVEHRAHPAALQSINQSIN